MEYVAVPFVLAVLNNTSAIGFEHPDEQLLFPLMPASAVEVQV